MDYLRFSQVGPLYRHGRSRVALGLVLACVSLNWTAAWGASQAPRVTVEAGQLEGVSAEGLHVYKGIPYAAPPVGQFRWRAPQPVPSWTGIRTAKDYGYNAPQKLAWAPQQSEDCLYLNVWAPPPVQGRPLPVMVWIHGGGFIQGSGRIDGAAFAKHGIVFVSLNYRLGRFGAFAHPALLKQLPTGEPPANFWLQDQVAALRWIQRNIAQFGGDPQQVTIFGVSAGGTSVNMLMACPLAKGLFHRAIAQSGVGGYGPYRRLNEAHRGREPLTALGEQYARAQGVQTKPDVAAALRGLPWQTIAKLGGESDGGGFEVVVDGVTLVADPQLVFASGQQNRARFIGGCNSFEGNLALVIPWGDQPPKAEVQQRLDRLAPLYGRQPTDATLWADLYGDVYFRASTLHLVQSMEQAQTPAWTYYFDYVRGRGRNSRGAGHGSEVAYVFDNLLLPSAPDRAMARTLHGHWLQFAKTGDPNGPGLPKWPAYRAAEPMTMVYSNGGTLAQRHWHQARFDILFEAMEATWSEVATSPAPFDSPTSPIASATDELMSEPPSAAPLTTAAPATEPLTTEPLTADPLTADPLTADPLTADEEQALRKQVEALFAALIEGDIDACIALSDPAVVAEKGEPVARKFFQSISNLIRFAKVKETDRTIKSISLAEDGKSAKVTIELKLKGKPQPPGIEVWGRVEGQWLYRETLR